MKGSMPSPTLGVVARVRHPPGDAFAHIRRRADRFWERTQRAMLRAAAPGDIGSHVRGNGVAADLLLEAVLEHGRAERFCFFTDVNQAGPVQNWISSRGPRARQRDLRTMSPADLYEGKAWGLPDVWFDVNGDIAGSLLVREKLFRSIYPIVSVQHGLALHSDLWDKFLRMLLAHNYECDSLVCTTKQSQRALQNLLAGLSDTFNEEFGTRLCYRGRIDVVPLCVDTSVFRPREKRACRKEMRLPPDAIVLSYVGYLSRTKADLAPLLWVLRRLVLANPNTKLLLILAGSGPDAYVEPLKERIKSLSLGSNVTLRRSITDEEKAALVAASDIFVLPSDNMQENFGLAPVEAMASGVPQVVSDWDGYRETVVHGKTGFLVPTCWTPCESDFEVSGFALGWQHDQVSLGQSVSIDLRLLQEYLQCLISDPALRASMGAASRARALELFSLAAVARRYDDLWSELTEAAGAISGTVAPKRFDQPRYFKTFAHYASAHLGEGDCVSLAGDAPGDVASLARDAGSELALPALNTDLLARLIAITRASSSGPETQSATVGHLVAVAGGEGFAAGGVKRHIIWLLKYGFFCRSVPGPTGDSIERN